MKSISLGYKLEKVRLIFEIKDSQDLTVLNPNTQVKTGKKWYASNTVHQATTRLKHNQLLGLCSKVGQAWVVEQHLGCGPKPQKQRGKKRVISEVVS